MKPPVTVGDLIHIREEDYCCGVGTLTLRVTEVPAALVEPEWVEICGVQILWNGDRGGERQVRVRVSALRSLRSRETI